jgi:hypothetical protein
MPGEGSGESFGATQRLPTFLTRHHLAGGGMYAECMGGARDLSFRGEKRFLTY